MSKCKRSISVLLAILMMFGALAVGAFAVEEETLSFTDVSSEDWFFEAVQYVYQHGIMTGIETMTFAPEASITRGMVVTTLFRIYNGRPANANDSRNNSFSDAPSDQWFAPYVTWAFDNGIVEGIGASEFAPMAYVDRQQFATMLYRYANRMTDRDTNIRQGVQWDHFTDRDQIADWAAAGLTWANYHRIITGRTPATIAPENTATRAEAATMLMRFIEGVEISPYRQGAEALLSQYVTLFSLGRDRNAGELLNLDLYLGGWFDQDGQEIETPSFLRNDLIPIRYGIYDLGQDEPPTIFVLFSAPASCEMGVAVYRFIDGAYQEIGGLFEGGHFFRDGTGRVILHYNDRKNGYHVYYYFTFGNDGMDLAPIISIQSDFDEVGNWQGYFLNHITGERLPFEGPSEETGWFCDAWDAHHADTPEFIFGIPSETLTPIHPLTDLQNSIDASIRARLGLSIDPS